MNIQTSDAQGLYTKTLIAYFNERIRPTAFLKSFFKVDISDGLEISLLAQRTTEKIAVDVVRGSDGNRNTFSNTTEKIFISPYFREYWDITSLDFYDRLWRASDISSTAFAQLINKGARKTEDLIDKIERTYELQRAQVLLTGVVDFEQGQIDFKRKAASLVDPGAGQYFANAIDPFVLFENGAIFLRTVGKVSGGVFNAILGTTAYRDLLNNTIFKARQNFFSMKLDAVHPPQRDSTGAVLMGYISAGAYIVNIWTYPEYYDNVSNVSTQYIDPKKVIMLPERPDFLMSYAATPQLLEPGQEPRTGEYIISQYTDEKARTREYHVESAGIPVPVAVDQIYTFKAVA